jgi:hypothetical protein
LKIRLQQKWSAPRGAYCKIVIHRGPDVVRVPANEVVGSRLAFKVGYRFPRWSADTKEHPPTETMNRMAGDKAMSSQNAQRQQQGQPTAAQEAQGAKPSAKVADQGC